jgi:hypothetical protein
MFICAACGSHIFLAKYKLLSIKIHMYSAVCVVSKTCTIVVSHITPLTPRYTVTESFDRKQFSGYCRSPFAYHQQDNFGFITSPITSFKAFSCFEFTMLSDYKVVASWRNRRLTG